MKIFGKVLQSKRLRRKKKTEKNDIILLRASEENYLVKFFRAKV